MSKTDAFENELLQYIFNDTAIASLTGVTTFYLSLHIADPTEAGTQVTSETTYGSYVRQAVARTAGAWVVTGNSVSPNVNAVFPTGTAGMVEMATHAGVGTALTGAGNLLYSGILTPPVQVGLGRTPRITTSSTITED